MKKLKILKFEKSIEIVMKRKWCALATTQFKKINLLS